MEVESDEALQVALAKPAVCLFWASWHPPSIAMKDVAAAIASEEGMPQVLLVEIEKAPQHAARFGVSSVPTLLCVSKAEAVHKVEGADPAQYLEVCSAFASTSSSAEPLDAKLKRLINASPVMVFMKGEKVAPFCKFSKECVGIMHELEVEFGSFNILEDEEVRQGLKDFSKWNTYPQIYIEGELIGGVDIIKEMKEDGSLQDQIPASAKKPPSLEARLKQLITMDKVVLFMKGNPDAPKCGFSNTIVGILRKNAVEFKSFDILSDEEVRQGLKTFSNWPTYPQLYSNGQMVGGLDIVKELDEEGALLAELEA